MRYWLTPPALYSKLNDRFEFTHDPCPFPRGVLDGLSERWGARNYVNPPFLRADGGADAWVRKAIAERSNGATSVVVLPVPWSIGLLLDAGAEVLPLGRVRWLECDTRAECPRAAPQAAFVLRA